MPCNRTPTMTRTAPPACVRAGGPGNDAVCKGPWIDSNWSWSVILCDNRSRISTNLADRMHSTSQAGTGWSAGKRITPTESTMDGGVVAAGAVVAGMVPPKPHPGPGEEEGGTCSNDRGTVCDWLHPRWPTSRVDVSNTSDPGVLGSGR